MRVRGWPTKRSLVKCHENQLPRSGRAPADHATVHQAAAVRLDDRFGVHWPLEMKRASTSSPVAEPRAAIRLKDGILQVDANSRRIHISGKDASDPRVMCPVLVMPRLIGRREVSP